MDGIFNVLRRADLLPLVVGDDIDSQYVVYKFPFVIRGSVVVSSDVVQWFAG